MLQRLVMMDMKVREDQVVSRRGELITKGDDVWKGG